MNLLLINWMDLANPQAGGAEVHLFEIFKRFAARGDRVTLVASGFKGGSREDTVEGIRVIRTGTRETFNFAAPGVLRRLAREERFDLVVEDINKVPLFTPLYIRNTPILVIIPHLFGTTVFRETNPVFASYVWLLEQPIPNVYRRAMFEVISPSTAADVIRRGIDPARIRVIHCGMDHAAFNPGPAREKFERPTVLYVGRIKRYKSVDVVLRAMPEIIRAVPEARLAVVGSGDGLPALNELARQLGIADRVEFTGFVPESEKVRWMRRSQVIVNPSPKEGWGLTNIEANACGTPAVASEADGLRDSVLDGETGFLFPYRNHRALAERVIRILTNRSLREKLERNAIAWAEKFTWEKCASENLELVDSMIGHAQRNA